MLWPLFLKDQTEAIQLGGETPGRTRGREDHADHADLKMLGVELKEISLKLYGLSKVASMAKAKAVKVAKECVMDVAQRITTSRIARTTRTTRTTRTKAAKARTAKVKAKVTGSSQLVMATSRIATKEATPTEVKEVAEKDHEADVGSVEDHTTPMHAQARATDRYELLNKDKSVCSRR